MKQESYIAAEFPGDFQAIQMLRSRNSVFDEICNDLELLGQELALFSEEESLRTQGAYCDVVESMQALRLELVELLRRKSSPVTRDL